MNGEAAGASRSGDVIMLIVVALAMLVGGVVYYSGVWWADVVMGVMVDGAVAALWLASAMLLGDVVARRVGARGLLRWCTAGAIGLGVFSLVILGLGLAGLLNFYTSVAILIVAAGVGVADRIFWPKSLKGEIVTEKESKSQWLWLAAVPFAAIALVGANVFPAVLWKPHDPHPYDVLCYHLQVPREWYELGRIMPLKHNVYSFFPFAAEMNFLLAMHLRGGPWGGVYLAQMMSLVYMTLAVVSVASAMPNRTSAIIAGVAMAATPWTAMLGAIAYNESALLLYTALAAGWMVRGLSDPAQITKSFVMAGAMCGFACGVKYTAAPILLFGFFVAVLIAVFINNRSVVKRAVIGAIAGGAVGVLVFSPWLIRNAVWAGNPVFPLAMRQLGRAHFTSEQVERFERAHRVVEGSASINGRLSSLWSEVLGDWRFGWILIPAALVAAAMQLRQAEVLFLLIAALLIAIFWLGFTHLMGRFFVPAVPLLAMLVGYLGLNRGRAIAGVAAMLLMAIFAFALLHREFISSMQASHAYQGLIRLRHARELWPEALTDIEKRPEKVALIGDSQAFYRPLPMSRLEYRTIFDVVVPAEKNIVDAWLGRDLEELRKDHYIILNPGELNRLSRTYYGIPTVPPQWQRRDDETIILAPIGK